MLQKYAEAAIPYHRSAAPTTVVVPTSKISSTEKNTHIRVGVKHLSPD